MERGGGEERGDGEGGEEGGVEQEDDWIATRESDLYMSREGTAGSKMRRRRRRWIRMRGRGGEEEEGRMRT